MTFPVHPPSAPARPQPSLTGSVLWLMLLFCGWFWVVPALAGDVACADSPFVSGAPVTRGVLHDPDGRLRLDDLAGGALDAQFQPLRDNYSGGYLRGAVWLKLCLPPGPVADGTRWLRIGPPMLDDIVLHLPEGAGYRSLRTGDHHPFTTRPWAYRLFALPVPATVAGSAYLRIETSSALNLRVDLWREADFQRLVILDSVFYGLLAGAFLLLMGFSLVAWRWLGERLYLLYAGNVLAGAVFLLMNAGFGSQFVYPALGGVNDRAVAWLTGPLLGIHVLFFTYLFGVRHKLPRTYPLMLGMAGMYALLAPLGAVIDWRHIGMALQMLAVPVLGWWGVVLVHMARRDPEVRVYSLAFLPWLAGLLFNALHRAGMVSAHFLINYGGELTSLVHLVLLPMLIVRRTRQAEREKERALTLALDATRRSERELEARVDLRTRDLRDEIRARGELQHKLRQALHVEQAARAQQREFVAMLSHEFRSPLTTIDSAAQNLQARPGGDDKAATSLARIRRAAARLLNLLENCLAAERLDAPETGLRLARLELRELLAREFRPEADVRFGRVRLRLCGQPVHVQCDRHLFGIAVGNLVDNALKYSAEDQPVTVSLDVVQGAVGAHARIEVRDQGPGVAAADRERIFERFYRGVSPGGQGVGLGLHLARVLARRHGGDIVLAEPEAGVGAVFVLSLPLDAAPSATLPDAV